MSEKPKSVISICAKCADTFSARLFIGDQCAGSYDGYPPGFMDPDDPGAQGMPPCGDYVNLEIDLDTGMILNWKKPSKSDLRELFDTKEVG